MRREFEMLTKDGESNVDEEIETAAALEEDTHGREDDGKDDFADIAVQRKIGSQQNF